MKKEQLTKLMLGWQGRTTPAAAALLSNLFESADGVLLEYAEKAESNAIQAKFFEGGRELRRKRDKVSGLFSEHLERDIFLFLQPQPRADAPGSEVLSLVSKDSFERSLALKTICEQVTKKHQELYYALSHRLGSRRHRPFSRHRPARADHRSRSHPTHRPQTPAGANAYWKTASQLMKR